MADFYAECRDVETKLYKYYCEGEWRTSSSGKSVKNINPSTNAVAYEVQACTQEEVDAVFKAAKEAGRAWCKTPLWKRADYLHKVAALLKEHPQPIVETLVNEIAKPSKDSLAEVVRSGDFLSYAAEEGLRYLGTGELLQPDSFSGQDRTKLCLTQKVPLGVVLCIPPFNYPVNLAVSKLGPALMAGNTIVLKPPTQGAVSATLMVQAFHKAGLPPGVLNLVTGRGSEIGDYLTTHPLVNCISFTGGDTGIDICKKASMIPLQMELGGKDAAIICPDADLGLAASAIIKGGFSYSGQRCTAVKVVLAHESIADELVAKVVKAMEKLTVGMPWDDAFIVPVVSKSSADLIESLIFDARDKGATLLQEYKREGNLIWPLLIDHVRRDMDLAFVEPFGPVVPIVRVKTIDEAIEHCNMNNLGLQGCVFTQNINQAIMISDAMSSGTIQVNGAPARGPDHFPFQGFRDSGIGSQGIRNSLALMSKVKSCVINLPGATYSQG